MGIYNAELFTNIGLCCYYAQHYDMVVNCFERALSLAVDEAAADVWYNIAHIAIVSLKYPFEDIYTYSIGIVYSETVQIHFFQGVGELMIAIQCLRLCISIDSNHASAYNNLGVLLHKKGQKKDAIGYFIAAQTLSAFLFEPFYNHALLSKNVSLLLNNYTTYMYVHYLFTSLPLYSK